MHCLRLEVKGRMAGPMSTKPTDTESNAYLRDPACGVPFDIRFEIEDKEGTSLGIVGGYKTILALKSPVFKAMLFGPFAEVGDSVKIRATSMFAFTEMLNYIYGVPSVSLPWSTEVKDLFLIADLAEKYNLQGLMDETVSYAENYVFAFRQEQLIDIVKTAEDFHVFAELSEALLGNCSAFLEAVLETPEDMNNFVRELSGKDAEDMGAAFRLLARVDHSRMAYAYNDVSSQEVISHLRNIIHVVRPRHRLQQLKALLEAEGPRGKKMLKGIKLSDLSNHHEDATIFGLCTYVFIDVSLRNSQMKDKEKASQNGVALTLDTLVEDNFTHEMSIRWAISH